MYPPNHEPASNKSATFLYLSAHTEPMQSNGVGSVPRTCHGSTATRGAHWDSSSNH